MKPWAVRLAAVVSKPAAFGPGRVKLALRIVIATLSLLPLAFGTLGLLLGVAMYIPAAEAGPPKLDSQFRFMSAWDICLALVAWWFVANIERETGLFKLVCLAIFL